MFVPFISKRALRKATTLNPRKIGAGGGGGGGGEDSGDGEDSGGGRSGGSNGGDSDGGDSHDGGSSSSGGGDSGSGNSSSITISAGGSTHTAAPFNVGGGTPKPIPAGQIFAGRISGGGTRGDVLGTSQYGSGYPGVSQRGVAGLGFPFVFWPVVWGGASVSGGGAYLHTSEYGRPDNTSRPGGPLTTATFVTSSELGNRTFRLLADNATTTSLISNIQLICSEDLNNGTSSFVPTPYDDSLSSLPQPEQTVQYYRASSVALTLDGYNNTADFEPDGTSDVPALPTPTDFTSPQASFDFLLLECLNSTISDAVPLVDSAPGLVPKMSILGLIYIIWSLSSLF